MCERNDSAKITILIPPCVDTGLLATWIEVLGPERVAQLIERFFEFTDVKPVDEWQLCALCGSAACDGECAAEVCEKCGSADCDGNCEGTDDDDNGEDCVEIDGDYCAACADFNQFIGGYDASIWTYLISLANMLNTYNTYSDLLDDCDCDDLDVAADDEGTEAGDGAAVEGPEAPVEGD